MKLEEIQKIQLDILIKFHNICEENNLRYYIIGGTMLGAIRHTGFIPWDDDIDVAMPRVDYIKFMEFADEVMPDYMELIHSELKGYKPLLTKIINKNTQMIDLSLPYDVEHIGGVYMDIFPLDSVKPTDKLWLVYIRIIKSIYFGTVFTLESRGRIKKFISRCMRLIPVDLEKRKRKIHQVCSKYKDKETTYVANFFGIYGYKEIIQKQYFGTPKLYTFEGELVYGVANYDKYLKSLYGNYMEYPPVELRKSHHNHVLSYKEGYGIDNCFI